MKILKWFLIPVIAFVEFFAFAYFVDGLSEFISPDLIDRSNKPLQLIVFLIPEFITSSMLAALTAQLLNVVYKQSSAWVSFVVSLPVLFVICPSLSRLENMTGGTILDIYRMVAYLTLMMGCTLIISKQIVLPFKQEA